MAEPERPRWARVAMMALGHGFSDFYATMFTPLVATFRAMFGLQLTGISLIGMSLGVFGSMLQPLFGLLGDRTDRGAMAAGGLAVSAVFIGCIGLAPNVVVLATLLGLGMLGVAAFHPSGAVLALGRGVRGSLAMALFLTGGGVGLAATPLAVAEVVERWGLPWLWVLAVPGVALAVWVFAATRKGTVPRPARRQLDLRALVGPGTGPVWALFGMATLRAVPVTALAYFASEVGVLRHWDLRTVGRVISLFMLAGVAGGLVGGFLAHRVGRRALLAGSTALAAPCFFLYAASHAWVSVAALGLGQFTLTLGTPLNVSLAQELQPQRASAVTGLMMGMAWGLANVLLLAVGALGEAIGLELALQVVASISALGAVLVVFVPAR